MNDPTLQQFVNAVSANGPEDCSKSLLHYKCVPGVVGVYNGVVAFKKETSGSSLVIPSAKVDNAHRISFEFPQGNIGDVQKFTDCVKTHCKSAPTIKENSKAGTISVKIKPSGD